MARGPRLWPTGKPCQPKPEISKATKTFRTPDGGTLVALDAVALKVANSEFVTLLGPSGCGKTTPLRTISGFEAPDSGDIRIDRQNVTRWPAHRRPVNTVFQSYALFPHLNVERNVGYALEIAGTDRAETRRRVGEIIDLVGLSGFEKRTIGQLSGGQQQRVALARALLRGQSCCWTSRCRHWTRACARRCSKS